MFRTSLIFDVTDLFDCFHYLLSDICYQPSFDKVVPPSLQELGLTDLVLIYSELCKLGKSPVIIDSADLRQDPEVIKLSN